MKIDLPLFYPPLYKNDFQPKPNYVGKFFPTDLKATYQKNLKELGNDWHYANKEIIYRFNSLGYRTKELDYYKDKDFVLVLGCSHTHGVGLAEDEVWHHTITKELGYDVLNAGYPGSGPDIQMLNSMLFLRNSGLRPKAVIIQWPEINRFSLKYNSFVNQLLPVMIDEDCKDEFILSFIPFFKKTPLEAFYKTWINDNNSENNSLLFIEISRLLWKLSKIPYYDFTFSDLKNISIDNYEYLLCDRARDLLHYGYKTHNAIGLEIYKKIKLLKE